MSDAPFRRLLSELRRRRVYQVAVVYVLVGWGALQVGDVVVEPLGLPDWTLAFVIVLLALGFPVAIVLAWAFQVTPEGVRRAPPLAAEAEGGDEASASAGTTRVRNAALIGLGMLIAVLAIGTYAFFHEAADDRRVGSAVAEDLQFLAVLPFANMSADAENEFFADGVMEDILAHLALVPEFAVVSRTTAMRYEGTTQPIPEIADELGVRYLLEGSVRREGDRVRINAQLVDGPADQPIWVETYDRNLEDIFAVQTEIATAIADALEAELTRGVAERIERSPTEDLEAYDLLLQGRDHFYRYTREGTERAIDHFRAALERDPEFALARAWLGRAFANYVYNHEASMAWLDSALVESRRAVEAQPDLATAHTALGTAFATGGILPEARNALERALELNPNDWAAMVNLGLVYDGLGRQDEAIRVTRRSLERESAGSHIAYGNLGAYYGQLGLFERCVEYTDRALALRPDHPTGIFVNALCRHELGEDGVLEEAGSRMAERTETEPRAGLLAVELYAMVPNPEAAADLLRSVYDHFPTASNVMAVGVYYGWALLETGRETEAQSVLDETEASLLEQVERGNRTPELYTSLVALHTVQGDLDEAFRWMDGLLELGWNRTPVLTWFPALAPLRADPRYVEVRERTERARMRTVERVRREGL